jgi:hypothetical protein
MKSGQVFKFFVRATSVLHKNFSKSYKTVTKNKIKFILIIHIAAEKKSSLSASGRMDN